MRQTRNKAKKKVRTQRPAGYLGERQFQNKAKEILDDLYQDVVVQWQPFKGQGPRIYAPVVDIGVGPFAVNERYEDRYTELLEHTKDFIELLIAKHNENVEHLEPRTSFADILHFNENSRCLLCIEIEDSGSRKHCLGNLINASALGRIGVLVARSERAMRVFVRQRVYLRFLARVGKNTFRTANALVLTADQFNECLNEIEPG
ncbi:MAG: hypothetical protein ACJ71W_10815 [Terriglobales bacterium]